MISPGEIILLAARRQDVCVNLIIRSTREQLAMLSEVYLVALCREFGVS